jgi:hypothetical protein
MFSAIVDALKTIINLKSEANRDRKTMLEINNLEDARREKTSGITPASFEQVRDFDPKVREIEAQFMPAVPEHRELSTMAKRSRPLAFFVLIVFLILILYVVIRLIFLAVR